MSSFITRLVSAVVVALLTFGAIYFFKNNGVKLVIGVFYFLSALELRKILFTDSRNDFSQQVKSYVLIACLWTEQILINFLQFEVYLTFMSLLLIYIMFILLFERNNSQIDLVYDDLKKGLIGFFYLGLLPLSIIRISELHNGIILLVFFLCIVIAGDIFAYLIGMFLGRHKIMPWVSPKKTMEGSIGGLFGSIVVGVLFSFFYPEFNRWGLMALALSTGLAGQFGDLFESLLKRVAHIKDSGSLIPGHGGVLDRVDGILLASPIFLQGILLII